MKAPVCQYRDCRSGEVCAFDLGEIADRTRVPDTATCWHARRANGIHDPIDGFGRC